MVKRCSQSVVDASSSAGVVMAIANLCRVVEAKGDQISSTHQQASVRCDLGATPSPSAPFLRRMPHVPPWLSGRPLLHGYLHTAREAAPAIQRHPWDKVLADGHGLQGRRRKKLGGSHVHYR